MTALAACWPRRACWARSSAPSLAAAVSGAGQDALAALTAAEAAGLATRRPNRPGSWRFSHALIRDGIYASLREDQRVTLHGRAAAALEPLAREAPERGGEVAAHLLRAAPDRTALRQAADWAAAAAAAATGALAFEDAASYLATALAAAEAAGASDADRATLLIEWATAEYRAGQLAASLQHAVAAADAAERARRLDLLADAALVVRGIGHHQVAVTLLGLCDRALADPDCPAARRARLLAQRASALAEIGDMEAAGADSAAAMTAAPGGRRPGRGTRRHPRPGGRASRRRNTARSGCGWARGPSSWPPPPGSRSPPCSARSGGSTLPTS